MMIYMRPKASGKKNLPRRRTLAQRLLKGMRRFTDRPARAVSRWLEPPPVAKPSTPLLAYDAMPEEMTAPNVKEFVDPRVARLERLLVPGFPDRIDFMRRRREDEILGLRRELAEAFGRAHGWRLDIEKPFGPRTLARRARFIIFTEGREWSWPDEYADHPFHFRTRDGRAAAMAAHLYEVTDDLQAWARSQGLTARAVPGSWWHPALTTMVLFTPKDGK